MIYRTLGIFLLVLSFSAAGAAGPVIIGQTQRVHSAVLNQDRSYQVYLPDSYPWWFVDAESGAGKLFAGFIQERNLITFAKTDRHDDIALFDGSDRSGNPKVVMVCSTPERSCGYSDFGSWLAAAVADARQYGNGFA